MSKVIYAEKPSLGRTIAAALGATHKGNGFMSGQGKDAEIIVTWGFGHMGGLVYPEAYNASYKSWQARPCPFIPDEYRIAPHVDRGVEQQLSLIQDLFKKENDIICATDDDREGELIFAYVCELVGYEGPYRRVKLDSLTTNGIRKAFSNLIDGEQRQSIVSAGRARAIADWVVGINITTASTLHFMRGKSKTMSVGRVQTPTLAMIVERELAITNFSSKPLYSPVATVTTSTGESYMAKSVHASEEDQAQAQGIIGRVMGGKLRVEALESNAKKTNPPLLYSQTTLQMDANKKLGFTAQQTLDYSQELYEQGLITYPRTSSQYLTHDMEATVHKVLECLGKMGRYTAYTKKARKEFFPQSTFDDSKVESHFAIIPTGKLPNSQSVSNEAFEIYNLVALAFLRLYYPPAIVEETLVIHHVIATADSVAVQAHMLQVGQTICDESGEPDIFHARGAIIRDKGWWVVDAMPKREKEMLPSLSQGDELEACFELKVTETKPPKRYTDETLVAAMKAAGKSLESEDEKDILSDPRHMGIGTDATRAGIIETLVTRGFIERKKKQIWATAFGIKVICTLPTEDLKSASLTAQWEQRLKAIECGEEQMEYFVRDIEALTRQWCKQVNESNAVIVTLNAQAPELEGATCPLCGNPLRFTKLGLGCAAYPFNQCRYTIWGTIAGKTLTQKQMGTLVTKGKTALLKGFVSRKGEKFDAFLVLDKASGKVSFEFPPREQART